LTRKLKACLKTRLDWCAGIKKARAATRKAHVASPVESAEKAGTPPDSLIAVMSHGAPPACEFAVSYL
jgi:hypothetical protein